MPYLSIHEDSGISEHWNESYIKAGTCYGQLYTLVGDLNLTIYDKAFVTFTNMDLAATNGIDPDELYAAVENGTWTYDYFYELVDGFTYVDSDGDGTVNVGDIIPLASIKGSEAYDGFLRAWDIELLTKNVDGSHSVNVDGNTKLEQAAEKLQQLYQLEGVYLDSNIEKSFSESFVAGNALFDIDILYRNENSNQNLRNAAFDYAVLPLPKYDTAQAGYYTTSQDSYNAMSVMGHRPEKLEAISATLELLSSKSRDDVIPYYVEQIINNGYASAPDKVNTLELVMDGVRFDTATIYSTQLNHFQSSLWRNVIMRNVTVAERWASIKADSITAVTEFDAWFKASAS